MTWNLIFFIFEKSFGIHRMLQHVFNSNVNMRRSCWNVMFLFSGKEIKPPIYFLLPVCAAGCSWPACGRPAGCWSHFFWPSCAFWPARRSPPSHRWGRSPRSRSAPPGRSGLAVESEEWLDYERREQCKVAEGKGVSLLNAEGMMMMMCLFTFVC